MRIALLTWGYPPVQAGGTELATQSTAKALAKRGYDILVVTIRDKGFPEESMEDGFRVYRVKSLYPKFCKYAFFCLKTLFILRKFLPDVIHAQAMWTGLPALITKMITGKPYIVWGQGSDIYFPRQFKGLISKIVLRNADAVIALTKDMKKEMQKVCKRDILVIGNGVNTELFRSLSKHEIRHRLNIKKDSKLIVFVGTLAPIKGVSYLIEALHIIRQKQAETHLLIVGDGEERYNLEMLVDKLDLKECVTFARRVANSEVPAYMAASDLFVLPSLSEGFPITIGEAMAAGLPIITTRVRGLPEIVEDGKNGFLIAPADPAQIADKTLLLLDNIVLREEISVNNKAWAELNSWDKVVKRLDEVYSKFMVLAGT